ncbi:MAG: YkvA family protein [Croceibacterium sp.]
MAISDDESLKRDEASVLRNFWRKLGGFAAQVPFAEDVLTIYYCAFDRQTPTYVRVALIAALAYFIDPFDLIPDVLPIIGLTDDAAVIATATKLVWDQIKPEHRDAARDALVRMNEASKT